MKKISASVLVRLLTFLVMVAVARASDALPGVAIAIVYDTSGSMNDTVSNSKNQQEAKFQVASEALKSILGKVDVYAKTHPVEAALITFQGTPVPLGKWDKKAFDSGFSKISGPTGGTPLGEAISTAANALRISKLSRKHIVVLTDGESNGPLKPEAALREMKKRDGASSPQISVVAFDVNSQAFDSVKKEGATVLPASGKNLESGLKNLFSEKILLEDEE